MTPWVKRLIIANIAMFVIGVNAPGLYSQMVLVPAEVMYRPWTIVTYMFLHGGIWHLAFNMLALFFFGPRLEARLGSSDFIKLYLASGIGGAVLSFIFMPGVGVVGASGAVFGVLFGFARYWPHEPVYIWGVLPVPARVLVIIFAGLSIYAGFSEARDGIAHFAHLGGFVGGYLYLRWRGRGARRWKAMANPHELTPIRRVTAEIRNNDVRRWDAIQLDQLHEINRGEVERIRRKIQEHGVGSLSASERAFMDRMTPR